MAIEFQTDAVLPSMHPGEILREEFLEPLEREVGAGIARITPLERAA